MYINLGFRYIHIYRDGIATAAARTDVSSFSETDMYPPPHIYIGGIATAAARTDAIAGPLAKPRSRGCYDCHGKSEGIVYMRRRIHVPVSEEEDTSVAVSRLL